MNDPQLIRLVLADDHALVLDGLRMLVSRDPDLRVVATATDGERLLDAVRRFKPNVVVLDIQMPYMDGLTCLRQLRAEGQPVRVLILTAFGSPDVLRSAMEAGVDGFALKTDPPDMTLAAIRQMANGQMVFPQSARQWLNSPGSAGDGSMTLRPGSAYRNSFATLRGFARERPPEERCEVCGVTLGPEHPHLLDPRHRQVVCACEACAVSMGQREGSPFLCLPRLVRRLEAFNLSDGQWDDLLIPVGMAFFFFSRSAGRMLAYYPSPAGPTESLLSLQAWEAISADNPVLASLEPDVEALLVNRVGGAQEYYLAPLDKCYELVGLIRARWRGLSGGLDVWGAIAEFFANLKAQSVSPQPGDAAHA